MHNIVIAGVGGQGLVLTTKIICEAALRAGYDVKSNDVIGLSQRGGKICGSVRFGEKVFSPNIPPCGADFLMALEPLEGLRYMSSLSPVGKVFLNTAQVPPVPVMMEKVKYPQDIIETIEMTNEVIHVNANEEAVKLGSVKVANTILLGMLAKCVEIDKQIWAEVISENVPAKFVEMNMRAFDMGYNWVSA